MDRRLERFFEEAKTISLTEGEAAACLNHLRQHMEKNPVRAGDAACHTEDMISLQSSFGAMKKELRLSPKETEEARNKLATFMETHPVDMTKVVTSKEPATPVWRSLFNILSTYRSISVAAAAILIFATGSGLSYAAEGALPGDALYAVKIYINEEMHSSFASTAEEKAQWESTRAQRRLDEAEQLEHQGRLTENTRFRLMKDFEKHLTRVDAETQAIVAAGQIDKAEKLLARTHAALRGHVAMLSAMKKLRASMKQPSEIDRVLQTVEGITDGAPAYSHMMIAPPQGKPVSSAARERTPLRMNAAERRAEREKQ